MSIVEFVSKLYQIILCFVKYVHLYYPIHNGTFESIKAFFKATKRVIHLALTASVNETLTPTLTGLMLPRQSLTLQSILTISFGASPSTYLLWYQFNPSIVTYMTVPAGFMTTIFISLGKAFTITLIYFIWVRDQILLPYTGSTYYMYDFKNSRYILYHQVTHKLISALGFFHHLENISVLLDFLLFEFFILMTKFSTQFYECIKYFVHKTDFSLNPIHVSSLPLQTPFYSKKVMDSLASSFL